MKYVIYIAYNLIYELVSLFIILYAETYLNSFLIPDKFIWNKDGTKRIHPVIWARIEDIVLLLIEGAVLLLLIYFLNRWFLGFTKINRPEIILKWTTVVLSLCTLFFICSLIFGFYFPLP
jgi:hypothetical protein